MSNDLISRQAAIDLLKQMRKDGDMIPWEGKDVFARIRKLPSAQPDIIRCRDCISYREGIDVNGKPFTRCNGSDTSVRTYGHTPPDWYCADAKRREQ